METLTGVYNVDLRVGPYPQPSLVRLVVPHGGAQDHNVSKDAVVGTLEQIEDENCLSAACLSTDDG